ncbi:synoviolin 1 isoform b [Armillaria fumosa]|nr:synoviolin 1 isoform b [Armillaria fumosa]
MPVNPALRQRARAVATSINSHRILLYGTLSTVAVCAAVTNALKNYSNFYSVAIYLSKSSRSVLVFANFAFILALLCGHVLQKIFFGSLRPNEIERLYDRLWFFVTESLLAFTIFRDEFDAPFAAMFGFLLFVKSFHWLASDRIEWMDQRPYPGPSLLFHVRMSTLFVILWMTDFLMLLFAVENTLEYGVGGMVLFACEYGILMASVANSIAKYILSAYDFRRASVRGGENAPPWEQKSMWTFYIELITDFSKLTTYLCFFAIILTFYGLPLNIVRDIYFTARSFVTRLRALHRYQTATRNMDQRYPNATQEELSSTDHTCIICREEMTLPQTPADPAPEGPNMTPKKLPCGHIFHFHCLRSWLERQQSCPTCRRTVLETNPPGVQGGRDRRAPGLQAQRNAPAPNRNNPAPNNGAANTIDMLRRLLNNPNAPNRPLDVGNHAVNVVIQYDIHNYPPQNTPNQRDQPPSQAQPLHPPPQFVGFYGPGGVWQPWPEHAALEPTQNGASDASTSAPTSSGTAPSTNISTSPVTGAPAPSTADVPASSSVDASLPSSEPKNASEAAALAALRRLNRKGQPRDRVSSATSDSSSSSSSSSISSSTSESSDGETSQMNESRSSSQATSKPRVAVPSLIPLDYIHSESGSVPTARSPLNPQDRNTSRSSSEIPISQLPPTLTDDQLTVLDRVTREAIDERIRILEGVSGAVYRCIDELIRVRSALPPLPTTTPTPTAPTTDNGTGREEDSNE